MLLFQVFLNMEIFQKTLIRSEKGLLNRWPEKRISLKKMTFDKQQPFFNQNIKYKFCNEKNDNNIKCLSWKMLRRIHEMESISRKYPYAVTSTP